MKINLLPLSLSLFLAILFSSGTVVAQTPVSVHGQLSVKGNRIVDKNGTAVQLRGMSLYWSQWIPKFYTYNTLKWLRDDWCIDVIRCPMAVDNGGYATNPTTEQNKIITMVDAAVQLGVYIIVDFHVGTGGNSQLANAQKFFGDLSLKYKDVPNILYEPWNEPGPNDTWATTIKPYHQSVIGTIRNNDPDNIIICGTRSWSQNVDEAAASPISLPNIAYTLHFYAATHKQSLRDVAQGAINKGIALFVTEYGTCEASGDGVLDATETNNWWSFLASNMVGCCNWSVADLTETSAALQPNSGADGNGGWTASQLKPSGTLVRNYLKSRCNMVAAVEDAQQTESVICYPNPFTESFELKAGGGTYVIYDVFGNRVETGNGSMRAGASLRPGTYTVEIQNSGGVMRQKIVKIQ